MLGSIIQFLMLTICCIKATGRIWLPSYRLIWGSQLRILPFALSLSKGERQNPTDVKSSRSWFDKLTTNG